MDNELKELRVSNDAMLDGDELRRRLADEGYLFFKRLQDPDKMMELRREMLTVMQEGGWLLPDTDPMDGIADVTRVCTEGDEGYTDVYHKVYALESFHRSAHLPEIMDMIARIAGKPILPHPQKIARLWFPQYTEHTTPIHQDYVHFQGSFDTWTAWAPVGDCPAELGGLAVIPGSHKVNRVLDHHFSLGAGGLSVETEHMDGAWHTTDYEAGDTLIFEALMIHRALPNVTDDRMRVSLDNRYFAVGNPVGDCPAELGGLAVIPGSHKVNRVLDHHFSLGAGGLSVETEHMDGAWHTTDYEAGDTLIFEALMIHRALPNVTDDRMRVSLDNRYFAVGNPVSEGMMTPHLQEHVTPNHTWEDVYQGWESDEFQYYWKQHEFPVRAGDTSFGERGFAEALELARNGNEHARLHLRRVVRLARTPEQAQRALEALGEA